METAKIGIVGVVGSGTMGSGIAQVFAQAGYLVHLSDVRQDLLERALKTIEKSLDRFVQKGSLIVPDRNSTLSRISPAPGLSAFSTCGLAVEAVNENFAIKRAVLQELDAICEQRCHPGHQHLVNLHYQTGCCNQETGSLHRDALHESGPTHETRRDHSWAGDLRCHLPTNHGPRGRTWKDARGSARLSRFCLESGAPSHDQRGRVCVDGRRCLPRSHRYRDEAGHESSHGTI